MRVNAEVREWMTGRPVTVGPGCPVVEAVALMTEHAIRHLPVVEGTFLVGLLSDRDLRRLAPERDPRRPDAARTLLQTPISSIMSRDPILTVAPRTTLAEAARIMVETKVSALPVVEGNRLVGIITSHDLMRALVQEPQGL